MGLGERTVIGLAERTTATIACYSENTQLKKYQESRIHSRFGRLVEGARSTGRLKARQEQGKGKMQTRTRTGPRSDRRA